MNKPTRHWRAALLGASATMIALGLAGVASQHGPAVLLTGVHGASQQDSTVKVHSNAGTGTQHQAPAAPSASTSTTPTTPASKSDDKDATDEAGADTEQGDQKDQGDQKKDQGPQSGHTDTDPNADHQSQGNE